jgi:hypothetical protein
MSKAFSMHTLIVSVARSREILVGFRGAKSGVCRTALVCTVAKDLACVENREVLTTPAAPCLNRMGLKELASILEVFCLYSYSYFVVWAEP